jgi:hypothetical protein
LAGCTWDTEEKKLIEITESAVIAEGWKGKLEPKKRPGSLFQRVLNDL